VTFVTDISLELCDHNSMIGAINASLAGLTAFGKKVANAAGNIANSNTDNYKATEAVIVQNQAGLPDLATKTVDSPGSFIQEVDGTLRQSSNVELSQEIPQMMIGQRGYEANLKTLQTEDEMSKSILNIIA
jgi:flagellar basal body rod protein FlgG